MQITRLLLILSACIFCTALGWELQGLSSYTVPVFMWSDKQIFSNAQVYDTISSGDMEFALASLLRRPTTKDSKLSTSFNNVAAPEVVILFVEPELRTDQVPYISSAFATTPGGSYSHIKNAIEKAGSSLVMPYAKVDEVTLLDQALLDTFESIDNSANIFMAGTSLFSRLRQYNGVKVVEMNSLLSEMKAANVFNNGVADLVIVSFDKNSVSEHDSFVGSFLETIRSSSNGNYVAVYTANMPATSDLTWTFESHAKREFQDSIQMVILDDDNTSNSSNGTNTTGHHRVNYFPGPFIEVLLVSAILITMLFTGACAIFSLQTPDKWEVPKSNKRE